MSKVLVTIEVEGLGKQEIKLDLKDAVKLYVEASKHIVDSLLSTNNELACTHDEFRTMKQPLPVPIPKVRVSTSAIARSIDNYEINPFTQDLFTFKKLVAYRCPECGRVTVRSIVLGDSNITHCHWCREDIVINEVVLTEVKCGNCNDNHTFLYSANGLTEMNCRICESPIDIEYYQDGNKLRAKSANLLL